MSKIICDVCGTSFPETASQCPICGCVQHGEVVSSVAPAEPEEVKVSSTYNYVKGGRFSKSNVRKRNRGGNTQKNESEKAPTKQDGKKSDKGLIVAVVVLLLAIMLAVAYIVLRVFGIEIFPTGGNQETTVSNNNSNTTSEYIELDVPCTGLVITPSEVTLGNVGATCLLEVGILPDNSTDKDLTFTSDNPEIATVDATGNITAVAPGQTYITITCGEVTDRCRVECKFEAEEDTTVQQPEYTLEDVKFNGLYDDAKKRYDITLNKKDQVHVFYAETKIPAEVITWTTDDKNVAVIEDGVITAVGGGSAIITAEYADTKVTCIVRCAFAAKPSSGSSGTSTNTGNGETYSAPYTLLFNGSKPYDQTDVTIKKGDTATLTLQDVNGKTVKATWKASSSSVSISGNKITGVSKNNQLTVSATFSGGEFTCTFRVS